MQKLYNTIEDLIKDNLTDDEDKNTIKLIQELQEVKERWYFTKDEFIKMGIWKSPRPKIFYNQNSENDIIEISKKVFSSHSEIEKIIYFTRLKWINIPASSAILMLTDPNNYWVIDIRVWQVLFLYWLVKHNPKWISFDANDWIDYLEHIRYYAKLFNTSARNIERTLFVHHKKIQDGSLYW